MRLAAVACSALAAATLFLLLEAPARSWPGTRVLHWETTQLVATPAGAGERAFRPGAGLHPSQGSGPQASSHGPGSGQHSLGPSASQQQSPWRQGGPNADADSRLLGGAGRLAERCAAATQETLPKIGGHCLLLTRQPQSTRQAQQAQQVRCMFGDKGPKGPCRFNTSRVLSCGWPEATALRLASQEGCLPWQAAAAAVQRASRRWSAQQQQQALQAAGAAAAAADPRRSTQQQAGQQQAQGQRQPEQQQQQQQQAQGEQQSGQPVQQRQQEQQQRGWQGGQRRIYPTAPGTWEPSEPDPSRPGAQPATVFQPAAEDGCPAAAAVSSAPDLIAWARSTGIRRLVMSGDSTMRQFYQRAIALSRAQRVVVDVTTQRYSHYRLTTVDNGGLRDSVWYSVDTYPAKYRSDKRTIDGRLARAHAALARRTAPFGAPGAAATEEQAAADPGAQGNRELVLDLVMGTYRWHQMANLRAYVRDVLSVPVGASSGSGSTSAGGNASSSVGGRNSTSGGSSNSSSYSGSGSGSSGGGGSQSSSGSGTRVRRELAEQTAFVLSACYWHTAKGDDRVWPDYWAFLQELRAAARHVVVLTCPVRPGLPADKRAVLAARNAHLSKMVAEGSSSGGTGVNATAAPEGTAGGGARPNGTAAAGLAAAAAATAGTPAPAAAAPPGPAAATSAGTSLRAGLSAGILGDLRLLDAALLAGGAPANVTLGPGEVHFQCSLYSTNGGKEGAVFYPLHGGVSPQYFNVVKSNLDGSCEDPVNFSMWQALLCLLDS